MKRLRLVVLVAVFAMIATACGSGGTTATTAAPSSTTAAPGGTTAAPGGTTAAPGETTAAPSSTTAPETYGGVLRIGRTSDITGTDPFLLTLPGSDNRWNVYETLITYNKALEPQPVLATSWEWSKDLMTLTLHLRKDVRFHNGKPFTSQDVKWSIEKVADQATGAAQLVQAANWITDIALPDDNTVVLTLDKPRPTFMDLFNLMNIADQQTVEGPDAATTENGTGPYVFTKWQPGIQVTFTKNKDYWDPSRPKVDEVDLITVPDTQTLLVQLQTGAIDVAEGLTPEQVSSLKDSKFTVQAGYGGARYIAANANFAGTSNKLVRQAINYAIDRERIWKEVFYQTGSPTSTFWPSFSPAYDQEQATRYTFDLAKAKELLDQAGVSNLTMDVIVTGIFGGSVPIAEILQSDLAKIGVTLNIRSGDLATWRKYYTSATFDGLLVGPYSFNQYDPASLFTIARVFSKTANPAGFSSPEYEALVAKASGETDPKLRAQDIYDTAQWLLDQSYIMPVVFVDNLTVMASNVTTTDNVNSNKGGVLFSNFMITK